MGKPLQLNRLEQSEPEFFRTIALLSADQQKTVGFELCRVAEGAGLLKEASWEDVKRAVRSNGDTYLVDDMHALVDRLDNEAFDLSDQGDAGYHKAFKKARTANAVSILCAGVTTYSLSEAVYEYIYGIGDRQTVEDVLGLP